MSAPPVSVRWALRVYALLSRGLPRNFRTAYGREMALDLEAILQARWIARGALAVWTGALGACLDLGRRMARERVYRSAGRRRRGARGNGGRRRRDGEAGDAWRDAADDGLFQLGWEEKMRRELREFGLAARALLRKPGFAGVAMLTLGLGIGSVVTIFTLVNAILLQPLPYPEADGIVEIQHHAPGLDLPNLNNSAGTLTMYREAADFFSAVAAVNNTRRVLTGLDRPEEVELLAVSHEFFDVFLTQPAMGRPFGPSDQVPGATPVAILLWEEWQGRYGGDPDILGKTLQLDGVTTEIVGVMPRDFELVQPGPIALAAFPDPENLFGTFGTNGIARLAPGVSLEQAQTQLTALQARIPERFPDITAETLEGFGWSASVSTLQEQLVEDVATTLWLLLGTVGFVLLIACANVANLFLVRAEDRQKEIAVRAAMGAGRGQVAASFVRESLVLGVSGGVLGVLVALVGVELLLAFGPEDVPRLQEAGLTPGVLSFAALLSIGTGVLLGLLPMTRYSARSFTGILRDGGRGSTAGRGRNRARSALVMSQLALALVLLVGSGLMFRSFAQLRKVELGFVPADVLTVGVRVGESMSLQEAARFYQDLRERVAGLPGVEAVGVGTQVPLGSGNSNGGSFYMESRPRGDEDLPPVAMYRAASPGYFASLGIPVLEGRDMQPADLDGSFARVWVDEYFAETFLDGNALGERITWHGGDEEVDQSEWPWAVVTGVVGDVKQFGLREDPAGNAYFPLLAGDLGYPDLQLGFLTVKVRPGQDEAALTPAIRDEVSRLNGQVPVIRVRTMDDVVAAAMGGESITLVLLGIAAGMALFLGSIGLFGVISYVVSQRTREIGVRIALGAEQGEVSGMVLKQGLAVAGAGVVLGLAAAFGLTRVMGSILYEVSTTDPLTFAVAPILLLGVSALATWLPARRASRVDPVKSLREE
jgi:predicted permease